jgi:type VI secretion system secreted protein Hcp
MRRAGSASARIGGETVAAVDYFLKLDGIQGGSTDAKHKGEIDLQSFSWGETNAGSGSAGGGGGAGKVQFHDFHVVSKVDKASPVLMLSCATGKHLKEAVLTARKAGKGQQEFLVIKMNDVIITSVSHSDSDDGRSESVSMAFAKVDLQYKPQKADGSLDAGIHFKYDIKANKEA